MWLFYFALFILCDKNSTETNTIVMIKFVSGPHLTFAMSAMALLFMFFANIVFRFRNKNRITSLSYILLILKTVASVLMSLIFAPLSTLPIGNLILSTLFSVVAIFAALITISATSARNYLALCSTFYVTVIMSNLSIIVA